MQVLALLCLDCAQVRMRTCALRACANAAHVDVLTRCTCGAAKFDILSGFH